MQAGGMAVQAWLQLAAMCEKLECPEVAAQGLIRATVEHPRVASVHAALAGVLCGLGRTDEASDAVQQALALTPAPDAKLWALKASIDDDAGRLVDALQALDAALAISPDDAKLVHNRALVHHKLGFHGQSLQGYQRALELGADSPEVHYNLGNVLQHLGRLEDAAGAYRAAIARSGEHLLAHGDLLRLLWRSGDGQPDADLRSAIARYPRAVQLRTVLAEFLLRAGRHEQSAEQYAAVLRIEDSASHHNGLGRCFLKMDQAALALRHLRLAVAMEPDQPAWHLGLAAALLAGGDAQAALESATRALHLRPMDQYALALRARASIALGGDDPASLHRSRPWVHTVDLGSNLGVGPELAAALRLDLRALHRDRREPVDQSLRLGTQTLGQLFDQHEGSIRALRQSLAQAVDSWVGALPRDAASPFLARAGQGWRFSDSWSSLLREGGNHVDHVHPHGWISGVCYLDVPQACQDPVAQQGWLQFGRCEFDARLGQTEGLTVQPIPGRVVLFPSYLWHGTVPFHTAEERLTVAFDLLPA